MATGGQRQYRRRSSDQERGFKCCGGDRDDEDIDDLGENLFEDKYIRHKFIRKVYAILFGQLLVTIAIVLFFRFYEPMCFFVMGRYSVKSAKIFLYSLMAISFVLMLIIMCCSKLRHTFPINFILLGLFTVVEGCIIGAVTCYSKTDIFLMAVGITAAVVVALSIFAIQTRCDFTICMGGMIVFLVVLIIMGIICIFVRDRILHIVYASLGTFVFSMYLIIDTQLIVGGKNRRYVIAPDEYILGALHLYIDIILIFLYLYTLITATQ